MWYLKMLSGPPGVINDVLSKEREGSDVSSHFQRGLYRACDVPSETSPEPSGEAVSGSDSNTASRLEAVWNARVEAVKKEAKNKKELIFRARTCPRRRPDIAHYLEPDVYVWDPIRQFDIVVRCKSCNGAKNVMIKFDTLERRNVTCVDGRHPLLVARYACGGSRCSLKVTASSMDQLDLPQYVVTQCLFDFS